MFLFYFLKLLLEPRRLAALLLVVRLVDISAGLQYRYMKSLHNEIMREVCE